MKLDCYYRRVRVLAIAFVVAISLAACNAALDNELVTGKGEEAYRSSLAAIEAEATEHEMEAFNWAVSDFDLERLHREYPNSTVRKIIRAEVAKVRETYPGRIVELEDLSNKLEPIRQDLTRITATGAEFFIDKNVFGLQPRIRASIFNGSSLPVSSLEWHAALYIEDATEPVATTILSNDYRNDGGLNPGDGYTVTFKVGFVRGDSRWTTLEIRNAASTRVVLEAEPLTIKDLGDRPYLSANPSVAIPRLRSVMEAAEKYGDI